MLYGDRLESYMRFDNDWLSTCHRHLLERLHGLGLSGNLLRKEEVNTDIESEHMQRTPDDMLYCVKGT